MFKQLFCIAAIAICELAVACDINSVSKKQLEEVRPGDKLVYRYQKDGKSWFYSDQITRIEGGKIYYNPGMSEATSGNHSSLSIFDIKREHSIPREELLKFETEQGEEQKKIIWIK